MQTRTIATLGLGSALLAAVMLGACSGGGSVGTNSSSMLPSVGSGSGTTSPAAKSGTRITVKIDRSTQRANAASTSKKPLYVSTNAAGLQVAVSAAGVATQTVSADLSTSSPLCTIVASVETCTLTIPTLAASENLAATEVDKKPTGEVAGFGTGFPTGSNILADTVESVTTTPGGVTNLSLGLDPVAANLAECSHLTGGSRFFGSAKVGNISRIVVQSGIQAGGSIGVEFSDASGGFKDIDTTPLPFVDVNGSPTPITYTAASSNVTLAPIENPSPAASPAATTTGSIPNDSYEWADCVFLINVEVAATQATPTTVTFANNLTASNPFTSTNYGSSLIFQVVPISSSSTTATAAVTGNVTANVTGSDFEATNGMGAESAFTLDDGNCVDTTTAGQVDATVASSGAINTTTWLQPFTITPVTAGTCTFSLYDVDTKVITAPITVTVGS
jgi:hypothetical protein